MKPAGDKYNCQPQKAHAHPWLKTRRMMYWSIRYVQSFFAVGDDKK